jgi:hypothetical protein
MHRAMRYNEGSRGSGGPGKQKRKAREREEDKRGKIEKDSLARMRGREGVEE